MDGRIIVITGASSGLGKGVAQRLAAQGARLVLAARRSHLLRELAEECGDAVAITCDVADDEIRSGFGEPPGDRGADAAPAAGDQGPFTLESQFHVPCPPVERLPVWMR